MKKLTKFIMYADKKKTYEIILREHKQDEFKDENDEA